jgi:hypothetical protein
MAFRQIKVLEDHALARTDEIEDMGRYVALNRGR